jgi:NitT/TauT family transport system substrate-binding protein
MRRTAPLVAVLLALGLLALVRPGPALAQQAKGEPVQIGVGYFPSWNGGWSGVVIKKKELWKKYLPAGSTVRWDVVLVGFPVFNSLLANKIQIGYLGDAPAMVATTKRETADLRIVSLHHWSPGNICAIVLVRPDAPDLKTPAEWVKWLDGKTFGVAGRASCGDRFTSFLETKLGVKFGSKLYLGPEVIKTQLQAGKIDAAQQFEPNVSQIVAQGIAKIAFTGATWNWLEGSALMMRKDFIDRHPEAAKGWLKADLEALRFIADHPKEVAQMVAEELPGWTPPMVLTALSGRFPPHAGAGDVNEILGHPFDDAMRKYFREAYAFWHEVKAVPSPEIPEGALYSKLLDEAARELGVKLPIATIRATGDLKGSQK